MEDEVYSYLGEWGPYQTRLILLLALPIISKGMQVMMAVVAFHIPHHRCRIPGWPDDTYAIQNEDHRQIVNWTIPPGDSGDPSYSQCTIFSRWNESILSNHSEEIHDQESCQAWVYDKYDVETSIISEFDLVCDRKTFRAHVNMAYLLGNFIGVLVSGYVCDWCGRKTVLYVANLASLLIGIASAFPPSVDVFLLYRFLGGAIGSSLYMATFVLLMELVGRKKRTKAASLQTILWLTGPFLVAGLSFPVRQWHYIQLISVSPLVFSLGHWCLLPESPRWLLMKKKTKAALMVMQKMALVNKTHFSPSPETIAKLQNESKAEEKSHSVIHNALQIFKYPRLVVVMLIIFFNWFIISMTYYGLSLNVGNLGGSLRVNFFLSCTVELIGYVTAWILLDRLGRKRSHCCFMLLAGLACLATILTVTLGGQELQWATTALAMVGKLGISASFTAIYLITAETFPTVIRSFSLACSSGCGRVGSSVSPYVADLALYVGGWFSRAVPLVIFGGLAFLAGLFALYLPETLHRSLPDTLEEAINFVRNREQKTDNKEDTDEKNEEEMAQNSLLSETTSAV